LGLNGAGKTTLLKVVSGAKKADAGTLSFQENTLQKEQVAFLETQIFFYPRITGREYLRMFQVGNPRFDIRAWNELFELPLDKLVDHYSTGMKKKLAFLGILALDRPLMLLDEPYNGIDLESTERIKWVLEALRKKGKTIVLTSHILESLTGICDSISLLKEGRMDFSLNRDEFGQLHGKVFGQAQKTHSARIDELL